MGMSDNSNLPRKLFEIPPVSERRKESIREFFRKHIAVIRTGEFALSAACAVGAWFGGGDMWLIAPVLFLGFCFAFAGIMATNISQKAAIAWCCFAAIFFTGEGFALHWHFTAKNVALSMREAQNDESRLGLSFNAVIQIMDANEARRKYLFQLSGTEKAGASLYVSASDRLTFSIQDVWGEGYPLEIRLGGDGVPIGKMMFLSFNVGIGRGETYIDIYVNNIKIASRTIQFEIDLGSRNWRITSFGADEKGNLPGAFGTTEFFILATTPSYRDRDAVFDNVNSFYKLK